MLVSSTRDKLVVADVPPPPLGAPQPAPPPPPPPGSVRMCGQNNRRWTYHIRPAVRRHSLLGSLRRRGHHRSHLPRRSGARTPYQHGSCGRQIFALVSPAPGPTAQRSLLDIVHCLNGVVGIGVLGETDKAKPAAAAGISVLDDNLEEKVSTRGDAGPVMASSLPPQPDQTPQTWCAKSRRSCATQGLFSETTVNGAPSGSRSGELTQ